MQTPAHDQALPTAPVALGPGTMLRQAREATGLSREDLARRTRLELKIIHAIESEDYSSLAAAAFIKGYIRSLAKELKIDPTPILNQYNHLAAVEDPALADFTTRSPAQLTSSSNLIRGISIGIVVIVIVLIALWWHRNYQNDNNSPEDLAQLAAESIHNVTPDPGTPLPYSYTIVDHSAEPLSPVNSWRRQTDGLAPPEIEPVIEALTEAITPEAQIDAPERADADLSTAVANLPTSGDLELRGDGESWLEISDVAGKRLYFGLIKPDQQIGLTGTPPYDLVIGNAAAVKLSYRGQTVDVRARAINGVARFSLDEPR